VRIAQVAPLAEAVPPKLYGGTERVISWLTEELVALGHEVTLFASADSLTAAELVPVWPRALRLARRRADPAAAMSALFEVLADAAARFEVIHCHTDWLHLPLLRRLGVPFVTTLHGRLDLPGLPEAVARFPGAPFVSISNDQRRPLPNARWIGTVHHGLPADALPLAAAPRGYLAFLGRMSPEKGPDVAIRLARAAGYELRIAAKIPNDESRFYRERIAPLIDGAAVRFVGEVDERRKADFLGNAAALLFPIDWPEPFGLVLIEAMACGTPVVAFRRGSVPEIVEDGVTGFIVDSEEEALAALRRLGELDRRRVRAAFERRFTARRMAQDYVRLYEGLLPRAQLAAPLGATRAAVADSRFLDGVAP
jgi:glycosyltransferase involved in cell wall biosynthesis